MSDKEQVDTYRYGTMSFPIGTKLPILGHTKCIGGEGEVIKNTKTFEPPFVIACAKCLRRGMIPDFSTLLATTK